MKRDFNFNKILKTGTPRDKARLLFRDELAGLIPGGGLLTENEVEKLYQSAIKDEEQAGEFNNYLLLVSKFTIHRFQFYALQENIKKITGKIVGYCRLWTQAKKEIDFYNSLLYILKDSKEGDKVRKLMYKTGKTWNEFITIHKTADLDVFLSDSVKYDKAEYDKVEYDNTRLKEYLDNLVLSYTLSMGKAKSIVIASEEFIEKYDIEDLLPNDIKDFLNFFQYETQDDIPDLYRRDSYLKLKEDKGEDDKEVIDRQKYAIIPAYSEINTIGLENIKKEFEL